MSEGAGDWWRRTTIYQVYPRSFQDSDGDGIGDLRGVIDRLPYLADLGIGTVWLSPFFASPQRDFGYDVSDYTAVAPEYGDLATARELIDTAHALGMRVVLDLVLNHTSDEHPWFLESASSRDNPKADWYLWHDGRGRGGRRPPNNWKGPLDLRTAWRWSETRRQWYLASFLGFQPDLNWRNPEVRAAMFAAIRFWLDLGVDGFRLDVFGWIMKDPAFRDNPLRPRLGGGDVIRLRDRVFTEGTPDNVVLAQDLRAVVDEVDGADDRMLVGEVFGGPAKVRSYLGDERRPGLHLVFAFDLLEFRFTARFVRETLERYEREFPAPSLPATVLENHDRSRVMDRVGGDERKARVLAMLLLTMRGVPTLYQGQEIGMRNTYLPLRGALDPFGREVLPWMPEWISRRIPERINRDEVRTPMPWDGSAGAGFTTSAHPWLPLGPESGVRNVAVQEADAGSMLHLVRDLVRLRRDRPELHSGSLRLLPAEGDVVAFAREHEGRALHVVLNMGPREALWPGSGDILRATGPGAEATAAGIRIPACTGVALVE